MISAVLFDLDETLLDRTPSLIAFLTDQHARYSWRLGRAPFQAWRDRFLALDARGHVHKSIVYRAILAEFGGDPDAADALLDDYREQCCRHARPMPGMAETIDGLRKRGMRLAIVTNGETEFQSRHIRALGLGERVDAVLISEAEGLHKPDATVFWRAAQRVDVAPANCIFVGDDPAADILGAHAAGMQTAWLRSRTGWPPELAPMPGVAIDALPELLSLI